MNATTVANWFIVGMLITSAGLMLRWQIRRARAADAERDRLLFGPAERDGRIHPNDPRLPQGINAHLDDYAALDPDLAPVFAKGLDRLRDAIRDEQQKGD